MHIKKALLFLLFFSTITKAADIIITLPKEMEVKAAEAKPLKMKVASVGKVEGNSVRFANLLPDLAYDIQITLKDGTIYQGVNLGWNTLEPAKPDAGEITDDDRQQIVAVLKQVLAFSNKNDLILLNGDHDRATALVQLVRDKAFHSDSGDEVIWHIELWYYKNEHGGWEKTQQTNQLLRRERFKSREAYQQVIDHLRWTPELGGLKVAKNGPDLTIKLKADAGTVGKESASAGK